MRKINELKNAILFLLLLILNQTKLGHTAFMHKKINKYEVFICHTTFGNLQGMKRSAASRHVHSLREYSTELNHQGRRL